MKPTVILACVWCLIQLALAKRATKKNEKKENFLFGRIPPGSFEYPALNGFYSPKEAAKVCESDPACGGFTFKGVVNSPKKEFEVYFFHYVPKDLFDKSQCDKQSFHWTSYIVQTRNFTELRNYKLKNTSDAEPRSCIVKRPSWALGQNTKSSKDETVAAWKQSSDDPDSGAWEGVENFDFGWLEKTGPEEESDPIYVNLKPGSGKIRHTHPPIDRCCKLAPKGFTYNGIDEFERISCNTKKEVFLRDYIEKRKVVILRGCIDKWVAKTWTIEGLLRRFPENWTCEYKNSSMKESINKETPGLQVLELFNDNANSVKVFQRILKNIYKTQSDTLTDEQIQNYKFQLLFEYHHPQVFPDDLYDKFDVASNHAYLMMGTKRTGTKMHIDPSVTDAYNGLIFGHKWWIYLPKDFYEFMDDYSCNESCSDPDSAGIFSSEAWYHTIYPQLRDRVFYGETLKSGLQSPGETVYMPHYTPHTVLNLERTLAVGDNLLMPSSMEEIPPSLETIHVNHFTRRLYDFDEGKRLRAVHDQLNRAAKFCNVKRMKRRILY